jgi:hypothetical protein
VGGFQHHVPAHRQERRQSGQLLHRPDQPQLLRSVVDLPKRRRYQCIAGKLAPVGPRRFEWWLRRGDAGTGLVGTLFGATFFLLLLLFAVQVIVRLYATSVLTSVAFDTASAVATNPDNQVAEEAVAERQAVDKLGGLGRAHTRFIWEEADANQVVLRVESETPSFLPLPASYRQVSRTVTVRTERFR